MYLQEIFEVVIGLIFTWLVMSTATMQVQEWLSNLLRWRAKDLENAIRNMLGSDGLTRQFYDHPLIRSLSGPGGNRPASKPSYIPSKQFTTVLLNIIASAGTESALLLQELNKILSELGQIKSKKERNQAEQNLNRLIEFARLSSETEQGQAAGNLMLASLEKEIVDFGQQFPDLGDAARTALATAQKNKEQIDKLTASLPAARETASDLSKVARGITALGVTSPELRRTLNSLFLGIEESGTNDSNPLEKIRSNIETWFNDSMDRLSGSYKRKTQATAFILGFFIAGLLNVDTIQISNQLWREPMIRQAIYSNLNQGMSLTGATETPGIGDILLSIEDQFMNIGLPIGWNFEDGQSLATQNCSFTPRSGAVFGIPSANGCIRPTGAQDSTNGWIWLFAKLAGWLITAVASAQGSSFWFDILMKIVNVRGAGRKPD